VQTFRGDAMAGKIFINYRREDSIATAGRLYDRLAQVFGHGSLFIDVDHIPAGVDFVTYLNSQVAECDVFLAVIGPNWLEAKDESGVHRIDKPDDLVAIEITAALARSIRVIPVLIDGARLPKASDLPEPLKPLVRRNAVEIRHGHFGRDADALTDKVREALGGKAAKFSRWRMWARGSAIVAVLLLIGWGGYWVLAPPFPLGGRDIPRPSHKIGHLTIDSPPEGAEVSLRFVVAGRVTPAAEGTGYYWIVLQDEGGGSYPQRRITVQQDGRWEESVTLGPAWSGKTAKILVGHASLDVDSKLEQSRLADDGTLPMGMQNVVIRNIRVRAQ
jgi:TIR domain